MSVRSVILGLLAATFIATIGYFNDQVPRLNHFVGNHFPIIIFGPLILLALLVRPLGRLLWTRWQLSGRELAVAAALALVACNIPGSGLLRFFSRNIVIPIQVERGTPGWRRVGALELAPSCLLANDGRYDEKLVDGLVEGLGKADAPIGLSEVPWAMWQRPLLVWLPLVAMMGVASICLALLVHRTWSQRERLPYPIARLAGTLLEEPDQGGFGSIFRSRAFWVGVAVVLAIHLVNGSNTVWAQGRSIRIPMQFDFSLVAQRFPDLQRGRWVSLGSLKLYPTAIAFAYFIASDVSLALGLSPLALAMLTSFLYRSGLDTSGNTMEGGYLQWQQAGSYFALALMVLYLGRRTYGQALRGALFFGRSREVRPYEVWACRVLILCAVGLMALVWAIGLDWPLSILLVLMILAGFLSMARMNAEAGLILSEVAWQPIAVFLGLFGGRALGLEALVIVGVLGTQFTLNSRECLLPFVVNALRLCDTQKLRTGRVAAVGAAAFVIAMVAGVVFSLWTDYNYGVRGSERWATFGAPRRPYDTATAYHTRLRAMPGALESSAQMTPTQRLWNMEPSPRCVSWIAVGAALVLIVYALRLRLPWWPLHPILFLFWGTWAMHEFAFSFLIGWTVKQVLVRFGARRHTARAFMVGAISGELLGGVFWMIAGAVHYAITGQNPPRYHVFPGG